jgi:exonuclease VII small subunit
MRIVAVCAVLSGVFLPLAHGAIAAEPGRYQMQKTESGVARLDTVTGEMTLCREQTGELVCRMGADERRAFEDELDNLTRRVETLEKATRDGQTALNRRVPSNEEIDQTMSIMERMMRRFMAIVKDLNQEEALPPSGGQAIPDKT